MSNSCWQLVNPPFNYRERDRGWGGAETGRGEGGGRERGKGREGGLERARERYVETARGRERLKDQNKTLFLDGQVAKLVGHLHRCLNLQMEF